ncbi:uncharacterized protein N7498_000063 [Penicillium cinerascens]|uniref:Citrate synthase n=1 Tax=Penicillium cinerascens TaxID=70096 RepID=A0A9W9NDS2_9EURO|nr:uncharacterized protein N7498_000063 [Penicillium cinerascens]KAJ5217964.1 hypothetical protein N7498_000063 [Penicillium cinerascens]
MSTGTLFVQDSRTGEKYEIPIRRNAVRALDLQRIQAPTAGSDRADQVSLGLRVHDPGLQNTAVVESAISFSDHERGVLIFRGFTLEQLWDSDFEDMFHLLLWGTYPAVHQRTELSRALAMHMQEVPDEVFRVIQGLPSTSPPLSLILAGLAACLASEPDALPASSNATLYQEDLDQADLRILQTVASYAVVFAVVRCHRLGIDWQPPATGRTYYENLFIMSGLDSSTTALPAPVRLSCFRRFSMLNADHGMALAVFSALVTASSLTDPISCLITSVAAAHGPLHFGATESAQRALHEIGDPKNVPAFLGEVKSGKRKLFGYGHRSYKGIDPRVRPIRAILEDLTEHNPLFKLAEAIEVAASTDEYFLSRRLYPNADFYGNFVFTGIGIETEMIPAAMISHRIMGIMAHWREYMGKEPQFVPRDGEPSETTPLLVHSTAPYSVFSTSQKRLIILAAALISSFSPISANIYYPALNSIAKDLRVSPSQINLTITTYMICQAIAPTFTSSLADKAGRRPAYICCFVIYIAGNVALALQHSFPTLLVLRAVQSCGSSGTVALASAVVADVITSAERGAYMGMASLGNILAPSLGPVAGGLLSRYWGWQSIFWFLGILATVFFIPLLLFFPETCRAIVGNGSIQPYGWSKYFRDYFQKPKQGPELDFEVSLTRDLVKSPGILNAPVSLKLLFHRPIGLILLANGVVFGSYYAVTAGIPVQFGTLYDLDALQIGLCFIPAGLGSLLSATANGVFVDWNYRRTCLQAKLLVNQTVKQDILTFPIERARLQIGIPMIMLAAASIVLYGFLMAHKTPLWAALLMIFIISFCITAAYNVMNVLIVDLYYATPATAMAANNLVRCSLGAGAAAAANPLMEIIGVQWAYCAVSGILVATSPLLLLVYVKGWNWRRAQARTGV